MGCVYTTIGGHSVILCGVRRRWCPSPGCGSVAELECDAPIKRKTRRAPQRGDARTHLEQLRVFYVHTVGDGALGVSVRPPGDELAVLQQVTPERWFERTSATCNRALCRHCAERVGHLDCCAAHARILASERKTGTGAASSGAGAERA